MKTVCCLFALATAVYVTQASSIGLPSDNNYINNKLFCTDGNTKYLLGKKWEKKDRDNNTLSCKCKLRHLMPHSKPIIVCKNRNGCRDVLRPDILYLVGSRYANCTCVNDFHIGRFDHGKHFHWRCDYEQKYCQSKGTIHSLGDKWYELGSHNLNQTCTCTKVFNVKYPQKHCTYTHGCASFLNVGGRVIFSAFEKLFHCKCFYDYKKTQPHKKVHFHWVCDKTGTLPGPWKPILPSLTG